MVFRELALRQPFVSSFALKAKEVFETLFKVMKTIMREGGFCYEKR